MHFGRPADRLDGRPDHHSTDCTVTAKPQASVRARLDRRASEPRPPQPVALAAVDGHRAFADACRLGARADPRRPTRRRRRSSTPQRPIAALLSTARRLSSRTERAAHAALKEEQKIGAELADLPAGWFVLASLDIECLDQPDPDDLHVDHAVIGPAGVFTIYVEHEPGAKVWVSEHAVTINGRESDRLRRARFEARRSSRALTDA